MKLVNTFDLNNAMGWLCNSILVYGVFINLSLHLQPLVDNACQEFCPWICYSNRIYYIYILPDDLIQSVSLTEVFDDCECNGCMITQWQLLELLESSFHSISYNLLYMNFIFQSVLTYFNQILHHYSHSWCHLYNSHPHTVFIVCIFNFT